MSAHIAPKLHHNVAVPKLSLCNLLSEQDLVGAWRFVDPIRQHLDPDGPKFFFVTRQTLGRRGPNDSQFSLGEFTNWNLVADRSRLPAPAR